MTFSVHSRYQDGVFMFWDKEPGIKSYKISYSYNFDQPFTQFKVIDKCGSIVNTMSNTTPLFGTLKNKVPFAWKPSDYSINNDKDIFIKITPVDDAGVDQAAWAMKIIQPYCTNTNKSLILSGVAASAASVDQSVEIVLPCMANSGFVKVTSGTLHIAKNTRTYEMVVTSTDGVSNFGAVFNKVFVRGAGGSATFSLECSLKNGMLW